MIPWLRPGDAVDVFPPVERALADPDGLLCAGGDLSPARLLEAYRHGIFPWYSAGQPILWWSPDPRCVLRPDELRVSRSLSRSLRKRGYRTTVDAAFEAVMLACADTELRPEGTWISPAMQRAYAQMHVLGHAHSIEVWQDEQLVGGLYGLALGQVFFGESMFSRATDASKVALVRLCELLQARGGTLIDCQVTSAHLERLGARPMARRAFVALLESAVTDLSPQVWRPATAVAPAQQPAT